MKNWQKKVLAVVLAIALIITGFATSTFVDNSSSKVGKETTVSKTKDNKSDVAKVDTVSIKDTKTEKSKEPNVSDKKSDVNNKIGDPDNKIDYQKIIHETKDEDYRKSVKLAKGSFVVVRKENKNTTPIQEEQWYKDAKATGNEVIMEDTVKDDNAKEVKQVSYKITTEEKDIWSIVDNTNNQNAVEIAEPVYKYYTSEESVPSAEYNKGMEKQWFLKDQKLESVWGNEKYGNTAGEGVVVAVIDTGVDYNHEDLQDNIWTNSAEVSGQKGTDDDNNGYVDDVHGINLIDPNETPMDDHGHGTHVAGQKVVKVFCHEEKSMEEFNKLNDHLFESANNANKFANVMGPFNAQVGNVSYVLCACIGAIIAIKGIAGFTMTPGSLISFLTYNKQFAQPINQITMQMNSIVMAIAGGERIFKLLDEEPEVDDGYVTLVRAKKVDGNIVECENRTGMWAWKHYHKDTDTTTYVEMKGEIVFNGVDFGYADDKIVLHDVKLYANPGEKLAFVGSTGAGKTTITNLINRFYDIQDGKI